MLAPARCAGVTLLSLLLCSCEESGREPRGSSTRVVSTSTFVASREDGERFVGSPAQVLVLQGGAPEVQLSAVADSAGGATWSALVGASVDDLVAGEVNARLAQAPLAVRVGTVGLADGSPLVGASSGTFEASVDGGGQITGVARTDAAASTATFSGRFVLSCWVYPEELGQAVSGRSDGTVTVRVEDVGLQSTFCQRVAHLR
jgi:hypothetical protein